MKSTRPKFTISDSESCTSDSTNSSSAYLLCHRPNDLSSYQSDLSSYQNGRKSSLDTARSNQKYYGRNFSVIRETCQRCSENDFIESNTDCSSLECESGSDVYCQKCRGENSLYPTDRKCCSQQCQKLFTSFQTIKKIMIILSFFNVILLFMVIGLISGGVIFLFKSENPDIYVTTTTTKSPIISKQINPNEKCEIKCKDLKILDEIKSVQKECCTLNDAVNYLKKYINRYQRTNSGHALTTTAGGPAIHLNDGKPESESSSNPHFVLNWKPEIKRVFTFDDNRGDVITVPEKGLYFTYSRIHFIVKQRKPEKQAEKYQMPVTHALYKRSIGGKFRVLQDSSLKCAMQNDSSVVHSSYLEGIAYFNNGDEIKIGISYSENLKYDLTNQQNYFGLFKV